MTQQQFINQYCVGSGVAWEELSKFTVCLPCACGEVGCKQWAMVEKDFINEHLWNYLNPAPAQSVAYTLDIMPDGSACILKNGRYLAIEDVLVELKTAPAQTGGWLERERIAQWMLWHGFATGHGESIDDLLGELSGQISELEADAIRYRFIKHDSRGKFVADLSISNAENWDRYIDDAMSEIGTVHE